MIDLIELQKEVEVLSIAVGAFIRAEQEKISEQKVDTKALNSLVTYVDKEAELRIVKGLKSLLPTAGFIAEEQTETVSKTEYTWIVDPLDGTTNYIHGIPTFATSIALAKGEELLLGVVYEVNQDECFSASKGNGAFLNGKQIAVSKKEKLADTLLATGFPYYDFSRRDAYLKVLNKLFESSRGLRRIGSAAVDLCYTACGRFDGYFEYSLQTWDIAAGALIVQEAGGMVSDFKGGNNFLNGKEILAASVNIYPQLLDLIKPSFTDEV